jgi:hypothetical protein
MVHETIRIPKGIGTTTIQGNCTLEQGFHPGGGCTTPRHNGYLGMPLAAILLGRWRRGSFRQARARTPKKAGQRGVSATAGVSSGGSACLRIPDRVLDSEAYRSCDSQRVWRQVSSESRMERSSALSVELPSSGASCNRTGRRGHRELETAQVARDKKKPPHQNLWVNVCSGRSPRLW